MVGRLSGFPQLLIAIVNRDINHYLSHNRDSPPLICKSIRLS